MLFKQRQNKTFQYPSRLSKGKQAESKDESSSNAHGFISKWSNHSSMGKRKRKKGFSVGLLIFILVLLLICMFLLENRFK
ncbi:hypothetical protein ACFFU9_10175 [Mariniflexile ostreae]|uniref:Uncharacterized protein n=1 Tax=Mariniflexile ostreae TaxID=1520892 RepID=A0ABV5FCD5_9FLAO